MVSDAHADSLHLRREGKVSHSRDHSHCVIAQPRGSTQCPAQAPWLQLLPPATCPPLQHECMSEYVHMCPIATTDPFWHEP